MHYYVYHIMHIQLTINTYVYSENEITLTITYNIIGIYYGNHATIILRIYTYVAMDIFCDNNHTM